MEYSFQNYHLQPAVNITFFQALIIHLMPDISGEFHKDTIKKIDYRPIIDFKLLLCQGNNI